MDAWTVAALGILAALAGGLAGGIGGLWGGRRAADATREAVEATLAGQRALDLQAAVRERRARRVDRFAAIARERLAFYLDAIRAADDRDPNLLLRMAEDLDPPEIAVANEAAIRSLVSPRLQEAVRNYIRLDGTCRNVLATSVARGEYRFLPDNMRPHLDPLQAAIVELDEAADAYVLAD